MRFEILAVTPEQAASWLNHNYDGNRRLRERRAASLARAISAGKWVLTHQPIALTKRGRLIDGQHRLRAIMMANQPVKMVVAYDVPEEAYPVLDSGLPRTMHERLRSDARHTSILTTMFRLLAPRRVAQEYEIEILLEVFGEGLRRIDQVPRPKASKIDKATHQAALTLRMAAAIKGEKDDQAIRLAWIIDKVRRGDMVGSPPIIIALYRQLVEGVRNFDLGVAPITDQFCRVWLASDPDKEGVARLNISDHSELVRDAKILFRELTEGVFDS